MGEEDEVLLFFLNKFTFALWSNGSRDELYQHSCSSGSGIFMTMSDGAEHVCLKGRRGEGKEVAE
jgi:hypothetical protein